MNKSIVTAADVRAYFRADASRIQRLTDEAAVTVDHGAKGRLHPEAIQVFNKGRREHRRYQPGQSKVAAEAARAEAKARREAAAAAGITVGKRGPLPKAARSLAVTKG